MPHKHNVNFYTKWAKTPFFFLWYEEPQIWTGSSKISLWTETPIVLLLWIGTDMLGLQVDLSKEVWKKEKQARFMIRKCCKVKHSLYPFESTHSLYPFESTHWSNQTPWTLKIGLNLYICVRFLYLYICVFVYLCICVFVYLCVMCYVMFDVLCHDQ